MKEGKKGEQATSNCALRLLLSKLCILLGWFLTNVLSKTVVVLHEKDKAMRCDLMLATIQRAPRLLLAACALPVALVLSVWFTFG